MLTQLFFWDIPGVRVDRIWRDTETLHIAATATRRRARCPLCRRCSTRIHSRYERTLADLPWCGLRVTIHLHTRRFVCRVPWCRRQIFTERLPALTEPSSRRTTRLGERLLRTGFALGGAPGARLAQADGLSVSPRTLLRLVRRAPTPAAGSVTVLGVDDWAKRRSITYGTILVNLQTHRVIDLLPDRTAATFAAWLRGHPEVQVITRDRGGAYAEGARQGAPQARQVADRFHLLKNVTDAFIRYLTRKHVALRQAAAGPERTEEPAAAGCLRAAETPRRPTRAARLSQEARARRQARYHEVIALHEQGYSVRAIARMVHLNRGTVMIFIHAERFPERQPRRPRPTILAPFVAYLGSRWAAGCHNATQLWQELRQQGFTGGRARVAEYVKSWRRRPPLAHTGQPGARAQSAPPSYGPRQTCWLLLRPVEALTDAERAYLTQLYHACPQVAVAEALVEEFAAVLRTRDVAGLYAWLHGVELSAIPELRGVARGIWLDRAAVEAAVETDWSNGQVEGQVNRLKATKRAGYGRCNFDLLRQRVLHAS
jgi:transposase